MCWWYSRRGGAWAVLRREAEKAPADFRFISRATIQTLDPARMTYIQDIQACQTVWEGLTQLDAQTFEPKSGTALWPPKWSDGGRRVVFTIRPEAKWFERRPGDGGGFRTRLAAGDRAWDGGRLRRADFESHRRGRRVHRLAGSVDEHAERDPAAAEGLADQGGDAGQVAAERGGGGAGEAAGHADSATGAG